MSAVTTALTASRASTGGVFTVDDLAAMPDDGKRYELLDGMLVVSPSPNVAHQRVSVRLAALLLPRCPVGLEVFHAPFDVRLARDTLLQPDLLVVDQDDLPEQGIDTAPLLAVEILSPSTRLYDLNLKKARYAAAGVPAYWIVDPGLNDRPASLTAWELRDEDYVEIAHVEGDETFTAEHPIAVDIVPSSLVAR